MSEQTFSLLGFLCPIETRHYSYKANFINGFFISFGKALKPFTGYFRRGVIALLLIVAAMFFDRYAAANFFTVLRSLEIETTPITPLILFATGVGLASVLTVPLNQFSELFPGVIRAIIFALIPLALFDAMQKSLLSLVVLGIGIVYIFQRLKTAGEQMSYAAVATRLHLVWNSKLVPVGFVLLIFFAAQNGLQSTTAVLGSMPTILNLMIGRLVYYTGVPLLIGLFFNTINAADATGIGEPKSPARLTAKTISASLQDIRTLLSALGSIATIIVPAIYAYFAHEQLLMNYFDLLQTLLSLAAH